MEENKLTRQENDALAIFGKGKTIYQVAGNDVALSFDIVRNYLTKGNGQVSDQDIVQFISICKFNQLNPFLNEAFLVKFGQQPAQMICLLYTSIPYMSDVATHAGMTVSCSQSSLKTVVEGIYRKSLDAIQNVDKHRNTITACESILEQIDPGVAQSKAQEKKITDLQNEIYQLKKDMPTLEDIKTLFMQSMSSSTNNVKKDK